MNNGYIALYRKMLDNPIWKSKYHPQGRLAITCLLLANHKKASLSIGGKVVEIMPGEFWTSIKSLTERTGLSTREIRTSLRNLENLHFLTSKETNHGRLITITNWDTYQPPQRLADKQNDKRVTNDRQTGDNKQECKNDKNNIYSSEYELFWKQYPKKLHSENKRSTWKKWNTALKRGATAEQLILACNNFKVAMVGREMQYIKGSAVFLGPDEHWRNYLSDATTRGQVKDRGFDKP